MDVSYKKVDIRLAVGTPVGDQPIKMMCPDRIHMKRVEHADDKGSLAVYSDNIQCFGCGFHIGRRYAALAFLLGYWDGEGDVESGEVTAAVKKVKRELPRFVNRHPVQAKEPYVPRINPYTVEAYQQFLFKYKGDRLVDELYIKRGLTEESVRYYGIGHTGTHYSIPVLGESGQLYTIRFRSDEEVTDGTGQDSRKYQGLWGRNKPTLFPMQAVLGLTEIGELWVTEGEFDAIASNQAGAITLTITNGAGNVSKIVEMVAELGIHVNRWTIATDQDGPGEKAAEKLVTELFKSGQSQVRRARWAWGKDLTEYYATGGSRERITYEEVRRVVKGALAAIA